MYLVKVIVKDSPINGKGVFADEDIKKGALVWKFNSTHDKTLSQEKFNRLSEPERTELQRIAYVSPYTKQWVHPPLNDPAIFTNHSEKNNLETKYNTEVSSELFFVAQQDIKSGEELTVNYTEFDNRPMEEVLDWEKDNHFTIWFNELKRIWEEKDHSAIKNLLSHSFEWYEDPFNSPLTSLEEVENVWLEINNQHNISVLITQRIIKNNEGFAEYNLSFDDVKGNKHVSAGAYYIKLDTNGKAEEFRQWWVSE